MTDMFDMALEALEGVLSQRAARSCLEAGLSVQGRTVDNANLEDYRAALRSNVFRQLQVVMPATAAAQLIREVEFQLEQLDNERLEAVSKQVPSRAAAPATSVGNDDGKSTAIRDPDLLAMASSNLLTLNLRTLGSLSVEFGDVLFAERDLKLEVRSLRRMLDEGQDVDRARIEALRGTLKARREALLEEQQAQLVALDNQIYELSQRVVVPRELEARLESAKRLLASSTLATSDIRQMERLVESVLVPAEVVPAPEPQPEPVFEPAPAPMLEPVIETAPEPVLASVPETMSTPEPALVVEPLPRIAEEPIAEPEPMALESIDAPETLEPESVAMQEPPEDALPDVAITVDEPVAPVSFEPVAVVEHLAPPLAEPVVLIEPSPTATSTTFRFEPREFSPRLESRPFEAVPVNEVSANEVGAEAVTTVATALPAIQPEFDQAAVAEAPDTLEATSVGGDPVEPESVPTSFEPVTVSSEEVEATEDLQPEPVAASGLEPEAGLAEPVTIPEPSMALEPEPTVESTAVDEPEAMPERDLDAIDASRVEAELAEPAAIGDQADAALVIASESETEPETEPEPFEAEVRPEPEPVSALASATESDSASEQPAEVEAELHADHVQDDSFEADSLETDVAEAASVEDTVETGAAQNTLEETVPHEPDVHDVAPDTVEDTVEAVEAEVVAETTPEAEPEPVAVLEPESVTELEPEALAAEAAPVETLPLPSEHVEATEASLEETAPEPIAELEPELVAALEPGPITMGEAEPEAESATQAPQPEPELEPELEPQAGLEGEPESAPTTPSFVAAEPAPMPTVMNEPEQPSASPVPFVEPDRSSWYSPSFQATSAFASPSLGATADSNAPMTSDSSLKPEREEIHVENEIMDTPAAPAPAAAQPTGEEGIVWLASARRDASSRNADRLRKDPMALKPGRLESEHALAEAEAQVLEAKLHAACDGAGAQHRRLEAEFGLKVAQAAVELASKRVEAVSLRERYGAASKAELEHAQLELERAEEEQKLARLSEGVAPSVNVGGEPNVNRVEVDAERLKIALQSTPQMLAARHALERAELELAIRDNPAYPASEIAAVRNIVNQARDHFSTLEHTLHAELEAALASLRYYGARLNERDTAWKAAENELHHAEEGVKQGFVASLTRDEAHLKALRADAERRKAAHKYLEAVHRLQCLTHQYMLG